jgi:hypothetical protein
MGGIQIPWSKISVQTETGFLTKSELLTAHLNRLSFAQSLIYQGSITVMGNVKVNHLYQIIDIAGQKYFVIAIDHNIDCASKNWTTTYQIQTIKMGDCENAT